MKTKLRMLLIVILILSLAAVACDSKKSEGELSFSGVVLEVNGDNILVKVNTEELGSDKAIVSLLKLDNKQEYNIEDEVEVYYDGITKESYPVQIDALSIKITTDNSSNNPEPKKANIDNFINEFAYKTSEHLLLNENSNYSPMSLYLALAIANAGANGETKEELTSLLGLPQNLIEEVIEKLLSETQIDNEDSKLKLANSLWVEEEVNGNKIKFNEDFLDIAKDKFNAEIFSMDFGISLTGKEMGKWVATNTNGVLEPEIITEKGQLATIINTVYFKDLWNSKFEESANTKKDFVSIDDVKTNIDFMNQTTHSNYVKHKEFTKANLGFQGGGDMFFILPEEGIGLDTLLKQDKLREIMELKTESSKVNWSVPKFTIDSKFDLIPILQKLGVNKAFSEQADFSNMIKDIDIFISKVMQGTHIKVEEGGVEAAAYTSVDFNTTSMPMPEEIKEMNLDRPFIYGITDKKGNILFIGTYVK